MFFADIARREAGREDREGRCSQRFPPMI